MLKKILSTVFSYLFYPASSEYELKKAIDIVKIKTLLDVGCGPNSPMRIFSRKIYMIGIDAHRPSVIKSKQLYIHDEYLIMPFLGLKSIKNSSFDCVVALEVIEHLEKDAGLILLDNIERIAKKKIILSTPNGFLPQTAYSNNPLQVHKSGWTPEELRQRGYKIIGLNGLKYLRGERASIKFKPKLLWYFISILSQIFVRNYPAYGFQLFCVKVKK